MAETSKKPKKKPSGSCLPRNVSVVNPSTFCVPSDMSLIKPSTTSPPMNVSLKLIIDKNAKKVLFAEANNDFVGFLFFLLSLPMGSLVKLLSGQKGTIGSFESLQKSVQDFDKGYLQPDQMKQALKRSKPLKVPSVRVLLPSARSPWPNRFYRCKPRDGSRKGCRDHVTREPDTICPICGRNMCTTVMVVEPQQTGYVKGTVTYLVTDDLTVKPMPALSLVSLTDVYVTDVGALEERVVQLTCNEGVKLLKASWQSTAVLTDVFLKKKRKNRY